MKNYYDILDVSKDASKRDIKRAYFSLIRKHPPEKDEEKFMEIRNAYDTLSDERKRKIYDEKIGMSSSAKKLLEYAKETMNQSRYSETIKALKEAIKLEPNNKLLKRFLGDIYIANGNSGNAVKIYKELVNDEPNNPEFIGCLAEAYVERGWVKLARKEFKRGLKIDKENTKLLFSLARFCSFEERYEEARETFLKILNVADEFENLEKNNAFGEILRIDILLYDYDNLKVHSRLYIDFAMENDELKDDIAFEMLNLANEVFNSLDINLVKPLVDIAYALDPRDKEIKDLKKHVDKIKDIAPKFKLLMEDKEIHEMISSFICLDFFPENTLIENDKPKDLVIKAAEQTVIENYNRMKGYIEILKRKYPDLYNLKSSFFKNIKNYKKRRKMLKERDFESMLEDMFLDEVVMDEDVDLSSNKEKQEPFVREGKKIGRNDPCPCGSGKKYKKCCGKN